MTKKLRSDDAEDNVRAAWGHLLAAAKVSREIGPPLRQVKFVDGQIQEERWEPRVPNDRERRDAWIAMRLLQAALAEPDGKAAKAVHAFATKHAELAEWVTIFGEGSLARTGKAQKIEALAESLRETLKYYPDEPWAVAETVVSDWSLYHLRDKHYPEDRFAREDGLLQARFLACVCMALPTRARKPLMPLAMRVLNTENGSLDPEALKALRASLGTAWPAACEASKRISEADTEWFLARALEALGEDPHARTAARRMRASRSRRNV